MIPCHPSWSCKKYTNPMYTLWLIANCISAFRLAMQVSPHLSLSLSLSFALCPPGISNFELSIYVDFTVNHSLYATLWSAECKKLMDYCLFCCVILRANSELCEGLETVKETPKKVSFTLNYRITINIDQEYEKSWHISSTVQLYI